ncbi:hypothetical protein [Streptomyces sp. NPDC096033]|uniref:hypothetical protein n=1 Tax=Streptomyces sp. NPDC096033 TaxID=3366071 RepID=UPI003805B097
MRRRIIGAAVAGAAGVTLALLPLSSASAHDHDGNWNRSSHSRWANNWDDDDDCGNGNWRSGWHHHDRGDHDWGRWDNANWNDWGGWR